MFGYIHAGPVDLALAFGDDVLFLQVKVERCQELETETAVLADELNRVGAVAARAAAREVVNGSKDEGIVPVSLHLEEVSWSCPQHIHLTHACLCLIGQQCLIRLV